MSRLTGGDPSLLRRINSAVVLHALRGAGSPTLTDLTRITGLSRPTVEGVVEGLFEAGLVVEAHPDESEARRQGRPPADSASGRRRGICWASRSARTGCRRFCRGWTDG